MPEVEVAGGETCLIWKAGLVNFLQMILFAGEIQVTSAAVMRWTEGSEVADPVGTAFAGVGHLAVWAVILEAAMGHLEQRNRNTGL